MEHDIFISYRRSNWLTARFIKAELEKRGYKVFLDKESIEKGMFPEQLYRGIEESLNVIVVLAPDTLDRCYDEGDWVRKEISHSLQMNKNIVPYMLENFNWPRDLPDDIEALSQTEGVKESSEYPNAAMDRIVELLGTNKRTDVAMSVKTTIDKKEYNTNKIRITGGCGLLQECIISNKLGSNIFLNSLSVKMVEEDEATHIYYVLKYTSELVRKVINESVLFESEVPWHIFANKETEGRLEVYDSSARVLKIDELFSDDGISFSESTDGLYLPEHSNVMVVIPYELAFDFKGGKYKGDILDSKRHGRGIMLYDDGRKYEGEWKNNQREGKGMMTFADGEVYEGEWKDDTYDGRGILRYADGSARYEGTYKAGAWEGYGVYFFKNGRKYEGEWKNNKYDGKGILRGADGSIRYEGAYKAGTREGYGVSIYDEGEYDGEWKNDQREGRCIMTFADGQVYDGEWKNDAYEGYGVLIFKDGGSYEGNWKNNKRNGKGILKKPDGSVAYDGEWEEDTFDGHGLRVFEDGSKYEGEFKKGISDGHGVLRYADGSLEYDGEWKNGRANGYGIIANTNGIKYSGLFVDGVSKIWSLYQKVITQCESESNDAVIVSTLEELLQEAMKPREFKGKMETNIRAYNNLKEKITERKSELFNTTVKEGNKNSPNFRIIERYRKCLEYIELWKKNLDN